jgi:hypothetical protein
VRVLKVLGPLNYPFSRGLCVAILSKKRVYTESRCHDSGAMSEIGMLHQLRRVNSVRSKCPTRNFRSQQVRKGRAARAVPSHRDVSSVTDLFFIDFCL